MSEEKKPIRILLGQAASQALTQAGGEVFVVVGKACHPDTGRWAIHMIPASLNATNKFIKTLTKSKP